MLKNLIIVLFCSVSSICLTGCNIRTPEIRGLVLDEETKQPIEGAWVHATIGVKTKTVGGDVGRIISLDSPHTRTGKEGRFAIPKRKLKKPSFPAGFGTLVEDVIIVASTADEKNGFVKLEGEELKKFLGKEAVDLAVYVAPLRRTEEEYFSHLQSLYSYCLTGRFGFEVPPVEGGCDEWELNYAITKHERYLERYKISAEQGKIKGYFAAIEQLSELLERKGDYKKAIEVLKLKVYLMEKRGLLKFEEWVVDKKNLEMEIRRLQKKLEEVKK